MPKETWTKENQHKKVRSYFDKIGLLIIASITLTAAYCSIDQENQEELPDILKQPEATHTVIPTPCQEDGVRLDFWKRSTPTEKISPTPEQKEKTVVKEAEVEIVYVSLRYPWAKSKNLLPKQEPWPPQKKISALEKARHNDNIIRVMTVEDLESYPKLFDLFKGAATDYPMSVESKERLQSLLAAAREADN